MYHFAKTGLTCRNVWVCWIVVFVVYRDCEVKECLSCGWLVGETLDSGEEMQTCAVEETDDGNAEVLW
jgi:hypothetical protein